MFSARWQVNAYSRVLRRCLENDGVLVPRRAIHRTAAAGSPGAPARLPSPYLKRTYSTPSTETTTAPGVSEVSLNKYEAACTNHLNSLFSPLDFPPEISRRLLTHASHPTAIHGHSGRFGFLGRRALEMYFLSFLHSNVNAAKHQSYDYAAILARSLHTYNLGEHVAPKWSLGDALIWSPAASADLLDGAPSRGPDPHMTGESWSHLAGLRSIGLYKVMGEAVQAVMGGIYHQFGGSVAHRVFHTRVLPHVLLPNAPEGVPVEFHAAALNVCERMGGVNGPLLPNNPSPSKLKA
ncbi:hypothetical protein CONPUDRAFT_92511 [Coniophora puteana RWD-64-598 SS2]|uniref:RNase III domain-containing protein n=1 Tax=Coniophora puteana (strain RWD-64-598) TaxID=741705 RepID=A0A5M3MDM7_CONPW|nr:uncharacterized protein CONPUDRAFT_92511 [Coniophora puteana RWD-64-598 SS2]EIW77369.1 hypothetical protein CONPUDRAFT_92511 [Coniophora puteana RWD-64-598 SS2]